MSSLVKFFQDLVTNGPTNALDLLLSVLPLSPFQRYISYFDAWPYMGWVNWFVPVKGYLIVWGSWITAVGTYYLYTAILRWARAIE